MHQQHESAERLRHLPASASSIVSLQPFGWKGPRILRDENNNGGAAGGGGGAGAAGAGDSGAAGAAGAGSAGAGDAGGAGAGAGGGQSEGGAGPSPYRPEGLPDHLFGKDDKETIDKLHTAVSGFRKTQGEGNVVPDNADGYTFEPSDKLKPHVANFDKDPVYKAARDVALKSGMPAKVFGAFMPALLEHFVDEGLVAAPIDAKAMLRGLAPENMANATDAEKETAGARRVADNIAWADGAKDALDPDIAQFLSASAADNPAANKLIEWLRGANNEPRPALGGGGQSGQSDAQMKERINDPRNNATSPQYDRAFAEETDRLSRQHYG